MSDFVVVLFGLCCVDTYPFAPPATAVRCRPAVSALGSKKPENRLAMGLRS